MMEPGATVSSGDAIAGSPSDSAKRARMPRGVLADVLPASASIPAGASLAGDAHVVDVRGDLAASIDRDVQAGVDLGGGPAVCRLELNVGDCLVDPRLVPRIEDVPVPIGADCLVLVAGDLAHAPQVFVVEVVEEIPGPVLGPVDVELEVPAAGH